MNIMLHKYPNPILIQRFKSFNNLQLTQVSTEHPFHNIIIQLISKLPTMLTDLEFLFTTTNLQKLQTFFDQKPKVNIYTMRDDKKNSLLHQAAFQNNITVLKLFLEQVKKQLEKDYWNNNNTYKKSVKQSIQALVNQGNNQGFTCMHYASYRGNIEMIKLFQSLGANVLLLTKLGLNCLHIAAQGDQLVSALYFYDKFQINAIDNKKGTALHWAAYVGSEDVAAFLLAQQELQIDRFDSEDQTALHVAVMYGNTSIVKKLLIKGADRTLENGKGQKPMDIAKSNEFVRIASILNNQYTLLDRFRFYCNVRIKYEPQQRDFMRVLWFVLLFVIATVSTHLLIVPNFQLVYLYAGAAFNGLLFVLYISLLIQPSIPEPLSYKELYPQIPICPQCKIPKIPKMHHCDICKVCIKQYDHHCPWINGCVGKHNIKRFPVFLGMLIISFCQIGFLCVAAIFNINMFVKGLRYTENLTTPLQIIYKSIFGVTLLIIGLFLFPICYLFYVQISNLLYGKTTFQRFGGKKPTKKNMLKDESGTPSTDQNSMDHRLINQEQEQQERCSFDNCRVMCCESQRIVSILQD